MNAFGSSSIRPGFVLPLVLAALVGGWEPLAAQQPAQRHVLLIVSDDHGLDTGAYGNPVVQTPHLDALAADGTLYTHAFATTASCSPSRSVILSGLHNHRTGQYGLSHAVHNYSSYDHVRGLPLLLEEAGYRTAMIGKYHVAPEVSYRFQRYLPGDERNPVEMAENSRAFISLQDDRPFFLHFATSDPHRSYPLEVELDGSDTDALQPDLFGNVPGGYAGITPVVYQPDQVIVPAWLPDNAATRAELAEYYQSVSRMDQGVGRLIQILREAGVYENTLILYLSDHGAAFPGAKTTVYEPGLRSPLIVRHPDVARRGVRSDALVSWVDITPTILDFAGVAPPEYGQPIELPELRGQVPDRHGLHGRSFLPTLEAENLPGWDEIFASHSVHEVTMYYPMRALRGRQYKLIWNLAHGLPYPFSADLWKSATWQSIHAQGPDARFGPRTVRDYIHRPEFELYHLAADPLESRNLAGEPQYAAVLAQLQEKLRSWQQRTSDPWLVKWSRQ
jgi:N-sulfoglucosamine sulfohydrolase